VRLPQGFRVGSKFWRFFSGIIQYHITGEVIVSQLLGIEAVRPTAVQF
jgi:hypothetical protein